MKPKIILSAILCFGMLVLSGCGDDVNTPEGLSSSTVTETAGYYLTELFGKDAENITQEDYDNVTRLNIVGPHITSSVYDLSVGFDSTGYTYGGKSCQYDPSCGADLSFLSNFKNLTELGIFFCPALEDVSYIFSLSSLTSFTLVMTNVSDLTSVASIQSLETLYTDASPIGKVKTDTQNHLKNIHFINANLTDISFLNECNALESLTISYNKTPLSGTESLAVLQNLTYLDISAPDTDFSFLAEIVSPLKTLRVGGKSDIKLSLSHALQTELTAFIVEGTDSIDLTPLDDCPSLERVNVFSVGNVTKGTKLNGGEVSYSEADASLNFFAWWNNEK